MGITSRQQVLLAYASLRDYYQVEITDRALELYADDLADVDAQDVVDALRTLRREPGRTSIPLPHAVLALINGNDKDGIDDAACELAGRVVHAIGKFGYMRATQAREWLGDEGWQIVEAKGGWFTLCANTMSGENAFFAQCRDLGRSILRKQWRVEKQHTPNQITEQSSAPRLQGKWLMPTKIADTLRDIQENMPGKPSCKK